MTSLFNAYMAWLEKSNVVIRDIELQRYGFNIMAKNIIILLFSFISGYILDNLAATFIFFIAFSILRNKTGGMHFQNEVFCFIFTLLIIFIIPLLSKYFVIIKEVSVIISVLNFIVIFIIGPVESINKPLSKMERKYYKKSAMVFSLFIFSIIIFSNNLISNVFAYAIVVNIFSLLFGYTSYKFRANSMLSCDKRI